MGRLVWGGQGWEKGPRKKNQRLATWKSWLWYTMLVNWESGADEKRTTIILWTERPTGAVMWGLVHSKNLAPCEQDGIVALIPVEFCRRTICILVVFKNVESSSRRHQIFDSGDSSTSDLSSFSSSCCFFGFFGFPLEDLCSAGFHAFFSSLL